jgi:hypothetical protein
MPDLGFSWVDHNTGRTVQVALPLWKDDNWNLGGYFVGHEQLVLDHRAGIQPLMHAVEAEVDQQYAVVSSRSTRSYR